LKKGDYLMSNNGKYKKAFISAEEINQQKSSEGGLSKEFSRSSGRDCHRRRVQMVVSKLLNGRRRH